MHFTKHALTRYKERIEPKYIGNIVSKFASEFYHEATPDNSIKNHTGFMAKLYERHGYNGGEYIFKVSSNTVFVCRDNSVITVFPRRESRFCRKDKSSYRK